MHGLESWNPRVIAPTHLYLPSPSYPQETDLKGDVSYPLGEQWHNPDPNPQAPSLYPPQGSRFVSWPQAPSPLEEDELLDDRDLVFCREKRRGPTFQKRLLCSQPWSQAVLEQTTVGLSSQPMTTLFAGGHWSGLNCVPRKFISDVLTPAPHSATVFRHRLFKEVIKLRRGH